MMLEGLCSIESVYIFSLYFYHDINISTGKFNIWCSCCLHIYLVEKREIFKITSLRFFCFSYFILSCLKKGEKEWNRIWSQIFRKTHFPEISRSLWSLKRILHGKNKFRGEKANKSGRINIPRNNNRGRSFSKVPSIDDLRRHDSAIRKR